MAFVLDTSVTAVWALADEASPLAARAAQRLKTEEALGPPLWWYEVHNLLIVSERRGRIRREHTAIFLDVLSSFPIQVDPVQDESLTSQIARDFRLSFYDAAYLAVARRNHVPIATLDKAVAAAARSTGVSLLE